MSIGPYSPGAPGTPPGLTTTQDQINAMLDGNGPERIEMGNYSFSRNNAATHINPAAAAQNAEELLEIHANQAMADQLARVRA